MDPSDPISVLQSPDVWDVYGPLIYITSDRYAVVRSNGEFSDITMVLLTLLHCGVIDEPTVAGRHKRISKDRDIWFISPDVVLDEAPYRGMPVFQKGVRQYFQIQFNLTGRTPWQFIRDALLTGNTPLLSGLFSGRGTTTMIGQPLVLIADALEFLFLQTHPQRPITNTHLLGCLTIVEALTQATICFRPELVGVLSGHVVGEDDDALLLSPLETLDRIAHDGLLSGVLRAPGFHQISDVLKRTEILQRLVLYVERTDLRMDDARLRDLSILAVTLFAATHRPGIVAFDYYLTQLPTYVLSLKIFIKEMGGVLSDANRRALVRAVWGIMILFFVTQLRPHMDESLLAMDDVIQEDRVWGEIFEDGMSYVPMNPDGYLFMRTLSSLRRLANEFPGADAIYRAAAWKLVRRWNGWTGRGRENEVQINVRL